MGWLWFLLGLWIGGGTGALAMGLVQARRCSRQENRPETAQNPR